MSLEDTMICCFSQLGEELGAEPPTHTIDELKAMGRAGNDAPMGRYFGKCKDAEEDDVEGDDIEVVFEQFWP